MVTGMCQDGLQSIYRRFIKFLAGNKQQQGDLKEFREVRVGFKRLSKRFQVLDGFMGFQGV